MAHRTRPATQRSSRAGGQDKTFLRQLFDSPVGASPNVADTDCWAESHRARDDDPPGDIARSQRDWLRVRSAPGVRGRELTELAAWLYPAAQRAPGGHVLSGPWPLDGPVPLDSVEIGWAQGAQPYPTKSVNLGRVLPLTDQGIRYAR